MAGINDLLDRPGDEILVFHRHDQMMHPHQGTDFIDAITAGIDHDLTIDIALAGMHGPAVISVLGQPGQRGLAIDFSPGLSRPPRQRLAELGRINITIKRVP